MTVLCECEIPRLDNKNVQIMQIKSSRLRVNSESLCCCPTINPRERIRQKELYSLKLTPWRLVSAGLILRREQDR